MKHKGSISQVYIERDRRIIPDLIRRAKYIVSYPTNRKKIFQAAASLPVKNHYISDESAIDYVRSRMRGKHYHFANSHKEQLYNSLYDEVIKMMQDARYKETKLNDIILIALTHPAPCVGLTPMGMYKIYIRLNAKKRQP